MTAFQRLRNLLGNHVVPRGGTIEQLAIKFPGGTAERSRAILSHYEVGIRCAYRTSQNLASVVYVVSVFWKDYW